MTHGRGLSIVRHMDIISHGLWGGVAFGRRNKKSFWLSFLFGIMPDVLAFGPFFASVFLGLQKGPQFSSEPPDPGLIPLYVHRLYSMSHSLIIFTLLFAALWIIRQKPFWEFSAWGAHILVDIPTHSYQFFPTPFLWPLSNITVNGVPWGNPWIFIPNVTLLITLYMYFFVIRPRLSESSKKNE